ncbi:MAG: GNAT family N-acetyltransferase [bacterium]|nr:GNAT family N-acetyltransferase [bacterium]
MTSTPSTRSPSGAGLAGSKVVVRPMRAADAEHVARCHVEQIPTGFLSSLGRRFLTHLYRAMHGSRDAILFVAVDRDERVVGFACGAEDVSRLYRSILLRRGWLYAILLLRHATSPSTLRRMLETLSHPRRVDRRLPDAELLSIALEPELRGTGVADDLLAAVTREFHRRGRKSCRVLVGAGIERANAFYSARGGSPAARILSHGTPTNVYLLETTRRGGA